MTESNPNSESRRALLKGAVGAGIVGGVLLTPKIFEVPAYAAASSGVSDFCCAWWSPRQPNWHSMEDDPDFDVCSGTFPCIVNPGNQTSTISLGGNPLDSANPMTLSVSDPKCGIQLTTEPVCGPNSPTEFPCPVQTNVVGLTGFANNGGTSPNTWAQGITSSVAGPSGSLKSFVYYAGRQEGKGSLGCGSNIAQVEPRCRLWFRFKVICV